MVKFTPLKDIHTSQISFLSWFHYGYELGETVFGLSISYIISCIFYFIVVYLPEQKKRLRAMKIIENRIDMVLGFMGITIYYYFYKNGIAESNDERLQELVEKIQTIDNDNNMDFDYQYIEKPTGNTVRINTGYHTEISSLSDYRSRIQQTINEIFKVPVIINVDHELIVVLEEINNCMLFKLVSAVEKYPAGRTPEFGKDLFKYYLLYKKLGKYIEPTKYSFEQTP
ncbi:hypothetical protein [Bacillus mycoides]|nr:hypothetical protein [Bacillus mycoides]